MTTDSYPLATALWGARFAGVWLPSCCYPTWGDTTYRWLVTFIAILESAVAKVISRLLKNQLRSRNLVA